MNELRELYKLIHHGAITEAKKLCAKLATEPEAAQFGYRQWDVRVRAQLLSERFRASERSYTVEAIGQRGARQKAEDLYKEEFPNSRPYVTWIDALPTEEELRLRKEAQEELDRLDGLALLPPDVKWEAR